MEKKEKQRIVDKFLTDQAAAEPEQGVSPIMEVKSEEWFLEPGDKVKATERLKISEIYRLKIDLGEEKFGWVSEETVEGTQLLMRSDGGMHDSIPDSLKIDLIKSLEAKGKLEKIRYTLKNVYHTDLEKYLEERL